MKKGQQSNTLSKICIPAIPNKIFSVQCCECSKWRTVPTIKEYEEIRSKFIQDPFVCSKKTGISCDEPADLEYDDSKVWIMDEPNIPKTPKGFKRKIATTKDYSRMACYYDGPNGERLKSWSDALQYFEKNPEFKSEATITDFNFIVPTVRKNLPPANPANE